MSFVPSLGPAADLRLARAVNRCTVALAAIAIAATACFAAAPESAENDAWEIEITPRGARDRAVAELSIADGPVLNPLQAPTPDAEATAALAEATQANTELKIGPDPAGADLPVNPDLYRKIYKSIPFSRAEYEAHPGYRHEATMSLLLGQPYSAGGYEGYVPRVLSGIPVKRRPTRPVFRYRPYIIRPYPGYDFLYYLPY